MVEIGCLQECADALSGVWTAGLAKPLKLSAMCFEDIQCDAEQGGFPAPVWPQDPIYGTLGNLETDILQGADATVMP
jgi:hypothetical protein